MNMIDRLKEHLPKKVSLPGPVQDRSVVGLLPRRRRADAQLRYLSQAVFLEEAGTPRSLSHMAILTCCCVAGLLLWSSMTEVNEVSHAPGNVVPSGLEQTVQHLDGGIVRNIHVASGELVQKNQVIATLDDGSTADVLDRTKSKLLFLTMTARRLQAQMHGKEPTFSTFDGASKEDIETQTHLYTSTMVEREAREKVIETQTAQKSNDLAILKSQMDTAKQSFEPANTLYLSHKDLHNRGLLAYTAFVRAQQDVIRIKGDIETLHEQIKRGDVAINEFSDRLSSLKQTSRLEDSKALNEATADIRQTRSAIEMMEAKLERQTVRSPVRGLIKALNVNTIGSILPPGGTIATIVPVDEELVVETQISPRDIGQVRPGQVVHVKISAFDFSKYGVVEGKLERISATTFTSSSGDQYYKGRIKLDRPYVGNKAGMNEILPGMTTMADIKTGRKTVLEYLLKPIQVAASNGLSEK